MVSHWHFLAFFFLGFCVLQSSGQDCSDHITSGLTCADLPDPCNTTIGQLTCPKFCGLCTPSSCNALSCMNGGTCVPAGDTYTCVCPNTHTGLVCHIPTNITNTNCPKEPATIQTLGCGDAEVVFMIEHARSDVGFSIDHEGDFIKEVIDEWPISATTVRVGVVTYNDTVRESFHIGDYNTKAAISSRITRLTRGLRGSGRADLAKALDYVRTTSFNGARPDAEKVVVAIVHDMDSNTKANIPAAAQRLKDSCVTLFVMAVSGRTLDAGILQNAVTQPYNSHLATFRSFNDLENAAKDNYQLNCNNANPARTK